VVKKSFEAKEGDCHLTLAYINDIICSQHAEINDCVVDFLAHMAQRPWEKPEFAIVLIGPKGVGKTFFLDMVNVLIDGPKRHLHSFKTSNPNDIFGIHCAPQLLNTVGLLLEEVTWGGDVKHENQLKNYITGHTSTINIKFGPIITVDNRMRIIMGANPGWSIPVSHDERRYLCPVVSDAQQEKHEYFAAIADELNNGGYAALMYFLQQRDISKFNYRYAPITTTLIEQKNQTSRGIERYLRERLIAGYLPYETVSLPCMNNGVPGHTVEPDMYVDKNGQKCFQVIKEKF
jgi:Family of unknown function (DUF5906)